MSIYAKKAFFSGSYVKQAIVFSNALFGLRNSSVALKHTIGSRSISELSGAKVETPEVKAVVYGKYGQPKEVLRALKYRLPPLTPTSIHLHFLAIPINPSDINQIEGVYPLRPPFTREEFGTDDAVAVAGNEGVAEVIGVGDQVKGFNVGDWAVMANAGFGTWRTHAVARPDQIVRIEPGSIDLASAATLTVNNATAYRMLKDYVKLQKGDYVIQNGGNSGVSQAVIQIAKAWGINTINTIRKRPDFEQIKSRLQSLGVGESGATTIVVSDEDLENKYRSKSQFLEFIGDEKANIPLGFNCVSGDSAIMIAKHLSRSGYLVTYGAMSRKPMRIPASMLIFDNLHFVGYWMANWKETHSIEEYREMLDDIIALIQTKKLGSFVYEENKWGEETDEKELLAKFYEIFDKAYPDSHGVKQILRIH
ncbi:12418_t:CDS:2 [Ambispora gerdemannii]|uniref:enoyl-[acyl-carrier-protein] reductase n=1 Tax=Ambispora gerdemannii TaxID=144530 RepID=A0A9N9G2I6_9GLOM|nr:12418_t:CDS:2 [Ambispora gerdemannii]